MENTYEAVRALLHTTVMKLSHFEHSALSNCHFRFLGCPNMAISDFWAKLVIFDWVMTRHRMTSRMDVFPGPSSLSKPNSNTWCSTNCCNLVLYSNGCIVMAIWSFGALQSGRSSSVSWRTRVKQSERSWTPASWRKYTSNILHFPTAIFAFCAVPAWPFQIFEQS